MPGLQVIPVKTLAALFRHLAAARPLSLISPQQDVQHNVTDLREAKTFRRRTWLRRYTLRSRPKLLATGQKNTLNANGGLRVGRRLHLSVNIEAVIHQIIPRLGKGSWMYLF